jgi:uncharacterized protein
MQMLLQCVHSRRPHKDFCLGGSQMSLKILFTTSCVGISLSIGSLCAASDIADAAMNKNSEGLRILLQKKADVNVAQADGTTALHWAVQNNDLATVNLLLAAGADVKAANRAGASSLYLAAVNGNAEMMERLLKAGADVNGKVLLNGETPLMVASRTGNAAAVKLLLDRGADVNAAETLRETTAIMWAAEQGHGDVIRMLAARKADVNHQGRKFEAKKQYGLNANVAIQGYTGGLTALVLAAREGAIDSVQALVDAGADLNKTSGDGTTAMLVAIQNGHYNVATYLVGKGANVNLANQKGWNPLYLAVKHRNIETGTIPVPNADQALDFIKLILDKGADPNQRVISNTEIRNGQRATWLNEAGATPFLRAALCGDITVMRMLIAKGADPKINTQDHTTPLMAAAGVGYSDGFIHDRSIPETIEAMKLILDLGADVNAANDQGLTALHGAAHKAALEEIQLLVDRGGDLSKPDKGSKAYGADTPGLLPIHWAEGVVVGVQSAIYHDEAVQLITKLMKERNIVAPKINRTLGGNAVAKKD